MGNNSEILHVDLDRALFDGKVDGAILALYADERPLQGMAGLLDWRFHGKISYHLRTGTLTGTEGEMGYLPLHHLGRTIHLVFVGAGFHSDLSGPGGRHALSEKTWDRLRKNLLSLKLENLGVSCKDFGGLTSDEVKDHFKGATVWIAQ